MAKNATFRILIAYQTYERFTALIRPQEIADWGAAELKSGFDIERGFGNSDWPGQPHLREPAAKSSEITNTGE